MFSVDTWLTMASDDRQHMNFKQKSGFLSRNLLRIALVSGLVCIAVVAYLYTTRPATDAYLAMANGQYQQARQLYSVGSESGNPEATNSLGNLYYLGLGGAQDTKKAAALYFEAARKGSAAAQLNLGNLYKEGLGVAQNTMRAFGWYRMSDISGNPRAEYYIQQIVLEYTLSPLQMTTAKEQWPTLDTLVREGL